MTDQELREMIRESIARHMSHAAPGETVERVTALVSHASHLKLPVAAGGDVDVVSGGALVGLGPEAVPQVAAADI